MASAKEVTPGSSNLPDRQVMKVITGSNAPLSRLSASVLNNNPELKIEITGHTDNKGRDSYNLTLSEERAKAVHSYLLKNGIPGTRITYKGYGKSKPVRDNDTEEGRHYNRRVEFIIQ